MTAPLARLRGDLQMIADMIEPDSRLLDIGCGDGALLAWLDQRKNIDGRGIELSMDGVRACVGNGLSVIQGNADTDLEDYPAGAFDYVVLSQTLQATANPKTVLANMARIGRHIIVSFPNFGYWRVRLGLLLRGRMPSTTTLPHSWYDTPNIHLCTILDFYDLCAEAGVVAEHAVALDGHGRPLPFAASSALSNLFAAQALFMLRKG